MTDGQPNILDLSYLGPDVSVGEDVDRTIGFPSVLSEEKEANRPTCYWQMDGRVIPSSTYWMSGWDDRYSPTKPALSRRMVNNLYDRFLVAVPEEELTSLNRILDSWTWQNLQQREKARPVLQKKLVARLRGLKRLPADHDGELGEAAKPKSFDSAIAFAVTLMTPHKVNATISDGGLAVLEIEGREGAFFGEITFSNDQDNCVECYRRSASGESILLDGSIFSPEVQTFLGMVGVSL